MDVFNWSDVKASKLQAIDKAEHKCACLGGGCVDNIVGGQHLHPLHLAEDSEDVMARSRKTRNQIGSSAILPLANKRCSKS